MRLRKVVPRSPFMTLSYPDLRLSVWKASILFFLLYGTVLRLWEYGSNYSLNHDEACLALNILGRNTSQLTGTLDYEQAAPIGFLVLEKSAVQLLGRGEYALRAFPTLCSLASLFVFWLLAGRLLRELPQLFAIGLFAVAQVLIVCGAWAKQYSVEVLASLALMVICQGLFSASTSGRPFAIRAICAAAILWFSYSAIFVLAGVAITLLFAIPGRSRKQHIAYCLPLYVFWLANGLLFFWFAVKPGVHDHALIAMHTEQFLPVHSLTQLVPWLWTRFESLGAMATTLRLGAAAVPAVLIGITSALARRSRLHLAMIFSVFACLAASALQRYPFSSRFLFFLIPFTIIFLGEALSYILKNAPQRLTAVATVCALLCLLYISFSTFRYQIWNGSGFDDPRGAIAAMHNEWRMGDKVYLSSAGTPSFLYYRTRFQFKVADYVTARDPRWDRHATNTFARLPVTAGRLWFLYFGDEAIDTQVLRHYGKKAHLLETVRRKYSTAALWDLIP